MISCKSCEDMLIFKTEQTVWRKYSVTQNTKLIFSYFLILLTNIRFIKNWSRLFDKKISSFNQ